MSAATFFVYYPLWHYTTALFDLTRIFQNFIWGAGHVFSIGLLIKTLLAPWRQLKEENPKQGLDIKIALGNLVVNVLMRLVGFGVRLITIAIGLIAIAIIILAGVVSLLVWLILPLAIPLGLYAGFYLILANAFF